MGEQHNSEEKQVNCERENEATIDHSLIANEAHIASLLDDFDFGSLDMDNFLSNIWASEDAQSFTADTSQPIIQPTSNKFQHNNNPEPIIQPHMSAEIQSEENGEMTLEDFLTNIGVLRPRPTTSANQGVTSNHSVVGENSGLIVGPIGRRVTKTKRQTHQTNDMTGERQQRMKIMNRESAARSRARKQAYTLNLEVACNHLTEENARLRQEQQRRQEMWRQRLQEKKDRKTHISGQRKNQTLRRWKSCTW